MRLTILRQHKHTHHNRGRAHIVPRHSWRFQGRDSASNVILDILEVHDASVVVILSREQRPLEPSWVNVGKRVVVCIPATVTEIDTADGSDVVIHDHNLFVVRPKLYRIYGRYSTEQTPDQMGTDGQYLGYRCDQDAS